MSLLLAFLFAAYGVYVPVDKAFPDEFSRLIAFVQKGEGYQKNKKKVDDLILEIDKIFVNIPQKDRYFLMQSGIFKTLLGQAQNSGGRPEPPTNEALGKIKAVAEKMKDPFLKWLALALYTDLQIIFQDADFNLVLKNWTSPGKLSPREKVLMRKLNLFLFWHHNMISFSEKPLIDKVYPVALKCLQAVHLKGRQYILLADRRAGDGQKLVHFVQGKAGGQEKAESEGPSLESLVDSVIKKYDKEELPTPVSDWEGKSEDFAKKETPLNIPEPSPGYVPPKKLPVPSDDWILDN